MTDADAPQAPHGLLRILGLVFGLAVVVGGVIGSGIMRAPGIIAEAFTTTPLILAAWTIGGLVTLLSAMPLVEAGASVPLAGGPYPIAYRAFGPSTAFFTGWIGWVQYAASSAFIAAVFGEYVHRLGFLTKVDAHILACSLLVGVGALNWIGTRTSGASQSIGSAIKGGAFIVLTILLFLSPRAPVGPIHPVAAAVTGVGAAVMAVRLIYQTYAGWDAAIYFSEEVHRPERNIARATFWGIGLVTVVYVLVNAAALHVLSPAQIAGSPLAVGDAAKVSLGKVADTVITAMGLFSLAAIVNQQTMTAPRIAFRMARHGALPARLGRVAPGGTPRESLVVLVLFSVIFAAFGDYQQIVRVYAPWSIGVILIVCLASIRLRYKEPNLERPWKMPLFPWVAILASAIQASLVVLVIVDDRGSAVWTVLAAVAPLPLFWLFRARWRADALRLFGEV